MADSCYFTLVRLAGGRSFGFNTYGKSTLCEVLRSIEIGETAGIDARATIPGPIARLVSISFAEDGKGEVPIVLKDAAWNPASPAPFRVHVFDTGFVSRNLYTGARAERSNKEALSQFVLGEQGVRQANEIAASRRRLAETKNVQRQLHEQLSDVGDVDAFVAMKVEQTEAELNDELRPVSADLFQRQRSLATYQSIQTRPVLASISEPFGDPATFEQLNGVLQQSLKGSHDAAALRLQQHTREHMAHARNPEGWINAGLNYASSASCPFCEQPLMSAPEGLIDAYRQYFDEAFNQRMKTIGEGLNAFENAARLWTIDRWTNNFEKNRAILSQYRELEEDKVYQEQLERFNALGKEAGAASGTQRDELIKLRDSAAAAIAQKRQAVHEQIGTVDIGPYTQAFGAANAAIKAMNDHIGVLNQTLDDFKRKSDKATIDADIRKLTEDERRIKLRLHRVNSDRTCSAYSAAKQTVGELEAAIDSGEKELAAQQSEYLKAFFDRINFYFTRFGSRHFTIELDGEMDTLGYQPVLTLVVKYRGVAVNPQTLGSVFSESDRRALALSIFWAKMAVLPAAERAVTITVLDDPVTSFDDARISAAIIQMRQEVPTLRQLIVFTHYHAFARRWLDAEPVSGAMGFHMLTRSDDTAGMISGDAAEFLHSEQHKLYSKFQDFIAGRTNESIGVDLRVFLETEVRDRYRLQLSAGGKLTESFDGVVNYLEEIRAVTPEVARELHAYRVDLNGPHHVLSQRGRDDWATSAHQMLDLIYTRL